jgi:hypothetical protein
MTLVVAAYACLAAWHFAQGFHAGSMRHLVYRKPAHIPSSRYRAVPVTEPPPAKLYGCVALTTYRD